MHRCKGFRTSVIEPLLDGGKLDNVARAELEACPQCRAFYREVHAALGRLSVAFEDVERFETPEDEFPPGFNDNLRRNIVNDRVSTEARVVAEPASALSRLWRPLLPAAVLMTAAVFVFVSVQPADPVAPDLTDRHLITDYVLDLDPLTVDFLEESELFLRTFVKLTPEDSEDLAESQRVSKRQLPQLEQRREALVEFPPVLMVLDDYEGVLRDIRNLPEDAVDEDITDIRTRIHNDGLVARMRAYQPRTTLVAFEQ